MEFEANLGDAGIAGGGISSFGDAISGAEVVIAALGGELDGSGTATS